MKENDKYIILFDGICILCNNSVRFLIKRDTDRKFLFATLQSEKGQEMLKTTGLPLQDFDTFILLKNDIYFTRSTAGLMVLKELDGFWKILYYLIIIPKPVRDFIYDMVAKSRYKIFGKTENCMIHDKEMKKRFLT